LREASALVAELDRVVVFIDEVEEIAGLRQPRTVTVTQGVTNEMLKLIPPFREQDGRLLIRATNPVRALDTAFLRHGRLDYVIPVGPPDDEARQAIWDRYLAAMPHAGLDMAAIVGQSGRFASADIEFAARRTAQLVFERVMFDRGEELTATADGRHRPVCSRSGPGAGRGGGH
jgi:transitional endoplasmic reticulum ATPase